MIDHPSQIRVFAAMDRKNFVFLSREFTKAEQDLIRC